MHWYLNFLFAMIIDAINWTGNSHAHNRDDKAVISDSQ